jgi:hypothetical protein
MHSAVHNTFMDRYYKESAEDLMASYNRSRHFYKTFGAPDDMDIEEEEDGALAGPTHEPEPARVREDERAASDSMRRPK